jgi:5-(aminomethyl)-3-furanmethanol phosphate kinase
MMATLVKVGGSLAFEPQKLLGLCRKLSEFSKKHRLIVVPGGGEFADVVRSLDARFSLSPQTSHRMAILGMDQYGLLLTNITPDSFAVKTMGDVKKVLSFGKLPVVLPSTLIFDDDHLQNSWDVTSDTIAVSIAGRLKIGRVLLLTDVDGIFTQDPKNFADAELINEISPRDLLVKFNRTSVDQYLPRLLLESSIDCYVVNGFFPDRIEAILLGLASICTIIKN